LSGLEIVYEGSQKFQDTTKRQVDELKKSSPKLNEMIEQLEKSKNKHKIKPGSVPGNTGDCEVKGANGEGTGTTTTVPDSDGSIYTDPNSGKKYPIESVLAHELTHASDKDKGIMDRGPSSDPSRFPNKAEERAVNMQNEYPNYIGGPRDKY
jgi:hypothetical protein